jgi:hypothetical protein
MVIIYGINLFYLFNSYTKDVIIYILKVFWSKYQCKYGPEDYRENSTYTQSIKWRCIVSFSIKHLYTQLDVAEFTIYHKAHTRTNGTFAHGEHDPESISYMFHYAPHMLLQPHFGQVWGWSLTLPKLGIWSPPRLPNV